MPLFLRQNGLRRNATYNTNNLKFELYVIQAEIDGGMGFPLVYLFLKNNGNCGNGIRTGVIIDFLAQLKKFVDLNRISL
ncbi:hypothetical protein RclHR1_01420016 [Rhizophagus clarus]|uniref:Uncharacterized protein n=1 Tax=Rhizophagus clarus TaxID=94130 RepID=A0A2Z6QBZ9_9GLOM|nr:hypothetical protein RclHR1_01420016 [Rhizophagus clarus]